MKYKILLLLLLSMNISCENKIKDKVTTQQDIAKEANPMESLQWILGSWSNISKESNSYERWEKEHDSLWIGMSITLKDADTIFGERMRLFTNKGIVGLYVETIGDEPNPVLFTQVPNAVHEFTFENQNNEFPSQITYTQPQENKIHAWVSGTIEGAPQRIDFYFTKD